MPRQSEYEIPAIDELPEGPFAIDTIVRKKLENAWIGLHTIRIQRLEGGRQLLVGKIATQAPEAGRAPEDDIDEVLDTIYGFGRYAADHFDCVCTCRVMCEYYNTDKETQHKSVEFEIAPSDFDEPEGEPRTEEVDGGAAVLEHIAPVIQTLVQPLFSALATERKALVAERQGVTADTRALVTDLRGELDKAYDRNYRLAKAVVGGREGELEARRAAHEAWRDGLRMQMKAVGDVQEMQHQHYVDEIQRARDTTRHQDRMSMIKEFGPSFMTFIPGLLQNVVAAVAKGREGKIAQADMAAAAKNLGSAVGAAVGGGGQGPPVPPASPSPVPPTPTTGNGRDPSAPPAATPADAPAATALRRFAEGFAEDAWAKIRARFGEDSRQEAALRALGIVFQDLDVIPAMHGFYKAFASDDDFEVLHEVVTEDQSEHFLVAQGYMQKMKAGVDAANASAAVTSTTMPPPSTSVPEPAPKPGHDVPAPKKKTKKRASRKNKPS